MYLAVHAVNLWLPMNILTLAIQIIIGVIVYVASVWLIKAPVVAMAKELLKK